MRPQRLDPRPYFAHLPDPRHETRNKLHKLHDILLIVLCAVLSGVEDGVGMEAFAEEKEAWLRGFLDLPHGIPSHDTLSDVLGRIDPVAFRAAFTAWATAALPELGEEQIGIDGKAVRGSRDGANPAVHVVSAFAGRARWVLAQQAVAEQSNEITAIPDLLALLDLPGRWCRSTPWAVRKPSPRPSSRPAPITSWRSRTTIPPCARTCSSGWRPKWRAGTCPCWKRWKKTTAGSKSAAMP